MPVLLKTKMLSVAKKAIRAQIDGHPVRVLILAVSALITVTGYVSQWSPGDIAFSVILAVAVALWGYYGFLRIHWLRYRPADTERWSRVSMLALWQAACIYDDVEPYLPLDHGTPCYATLQMLKSEHTNGRLSFEPEDDNGWPRVRLEDLRILAGHLGDKPKCLFPPDALHDQR